MQHELKVGYQFKIKYSQVQSSKPQKPQNTDFREKSSTFAKMTDRRYGNRTYDNYDTTGTTYDTTGTSYDPTGYSTYGTTGVYDAGYGTTTYDPSTGAYDQHLDYRTDDARRHHRERLDDTGVYRHRDVDRHDDGTTHVHREYDNPNTGTSYHRDYER